jgi:hypothetical protein
MDFPANLPFCFERYATGLTKIHIFAARNWKMCQKNLLNAKWHRNRGKEANS